MKLYIDTKKMTFNEEKNLIEHEIILGISDLEFYGYDSTISLKDNNKFIKDTLKITYVKDNEGNDILRDKQFKVRADGWNSFPLYEIVNGKIVPFDYTKYDYFANADRRVVLASKLSELYNSPSEAKIIRKTLKKILDHLEIVDDDFEKYNRKIEKVISKLPKNRGEK